MRIQVYIICRSVVVIIKCVVESLQCHAFVCESRQTARKVTYCLATAFQEYSKSIRAADAGSKRFAIDLRSPEDLEAELRAADSSEA